MSAAQLEIPEQEEGFALTPLKQQVAERLASHRSRRLRAAGEHGLGGARVESDAAAGGTSRTSEIAAAVAERYAQTQSYRVFLAAEAEKAMAAAAVAARSAQAIAEAQRALLEELDAAAAHEAPVAARVEAGGFKVRMYEDVGRPVISAQTRAEEMEESLALDEEIEFRLAPAVEMEPSVAIPGNLLEFPRQLVATRKARPRYAEGPLRDEAPEEQEGSQLRIFEVEAAQIGTAPVVESAAPEWSSIWLEALVPEGQPAVAEAEFAAMSRPEAAPGAQRVMSVVVDATLIGAAFVCFATVFAYRAQVLPSPGFAAGAAVVTLAALFVMYRMLFFTFSDATPGMRYARVDLCTLQDENPTRAAMRKRTFAIVLAAAPLGMGFLWAFLDEDRLGWHDRISKMYPRGY